MTPLPLVIVIFGCLIVFGICGVAFFRIERRRRQELRAIDQDHRRRMAKIEQDYDEAILKTRFVVQGHSRVPRLIQFGQGCNAPGSCGN